MGGSNHTPASTVYYAKLNANGSVGTWNTASNALPATRSNATSVVANGYVYVMGGSGTNTVYYAQLNTSGNVGSWYTATNSLPDAREVARAVIANGYVYVMGGDDSIGNPTSTVYYARLGSPLMVGGSIDLVSLQGGNLADANGDDSTGSVGGSITAGNITAVGGLQVQGQANFADSVNIIRGLVANGGIESNGDVSVLTSSTSAFTVQNAANSTAVFDVDTVGGRVGINVAASAAAANLEVNGSGAMPQLRVSNDNGDYLDFLIKSDGQTALNTDQTMLQFKSPNNSPSWATKGSWGNSAPTDTAYAAPTLGDLDNDGKTDLLVGYGAAYSANKWDGAAPSGYNSLPCTSNNNGSPSFADFTGDGVPDLICGTTSGSNFPYYQNTGTINAPVWSSMSSIAPPDSNPYQIALTDLNNDGKMDIMVESQSVCGNPSYKMNTGTTSTPNWTAAWTGMSQGSSCNNYVAYADASGDNLPDAVYYNTTNTFTYVRNSGTSSVPSITNSNNSTNFTFNGLANNARGSFIDFNSDGKVDIAWINPSSTTSVTVMFARNTGTTSAPNWVRETSWDFTQTIGVANGMPWVSFVSVSGTNQPAQTLGSRSLPESTKTAYAIIARSSDTSYGLGGTSYYAAVKNNGNISSGSIKAFRNTGTNVSPIWTAQPSWDLATTSYFPVPTLVDLNGDGKKDVVVGSEDGISYAYQNTGTVSVPAWTAASSWNLPDVGIAAAPAFGDINNDGKLDALIGADDGGSYAYQNTGTVSVPAWTRASGWDVTDIGSNAAPILGDLDADGDLDTIIGASDGNLYTYKNIGNATTPTWSSYGNWQGVDVGSYAVPAATDFGGDNDLDLIIGDATGAVTAQENVASKDTVPFSLKIVNASPSWDTKSAWGNSAPTDAAYAAPALADLNNDGVTDMLVGYGQSTTPNWQTSVAGYTSSLPCTGVNGPSVSFGDFTNDGINDLVCGAINDTTNTLKWYTNTGTAASPTWTLTGNRLLNLFGSQSVYVTLADLTGDGKLDLVYSSNDGSNLYYTANTGTVSSPTWTGAATSIGASEKRRQVAFTDIDGDGKQDVVFANTSAIAYRLNTGTASAPSFSTGSAVNIDAAPGVTNPSVALADLDNDGLKDIAVSGLNSTTTTNVSFYQNTGSSTAQAWTRKASWDVSMTGGQASSYSTVAFSEPASVTVGARKARVAGLYMATLSPYTGIHSTTNVVQGRMLTGGAGSIKAYRNTGTNVSPIWTAQPSWDLATTTYFPVPTFADLNNDGKKDVLVGADDGVSYAYRNSGTVSVPAWTAQSSWNVPDVGVSASPVFGDIDNDGKLDALVGADDGISYAYRNSGTSLVPSWTRTSGWDIGDIGSNAAPVLNDLDTDGDLDAIIGALDGNLYAYKNTGSTSTPTWNSYGNWQGIDVGTYAVPTTADLGGDNDLDLMIGDATGAVTAQENVASKDATNAMAINNDGNLIVGGSPNEATAKLTVVSSSPNTDALLVTSSVYTNQERTFGYGYSSAGGYDEVNQVITTSDGGYAVTGSVNFNLFIAKYDKNGDVQWKRQWNTAGSSVSNIYKGWGIAEYSTGGYCVTGGNSNSSGDIHTLKFDSQGNLVWSRSYGGVGVSPYFFPDTATSATTLLDGSCVVAGEFSDSSSGMIAGLVKYDSAGNVTWAHVKSPVGQSGYRGYAGRMKMLSDGSYAFLGNFSYTSMSTSYAFFTRVADGSAASDNNYKLSDASAYMYLNDLVQTGTSSQIVAVGAFNNAPFIGTFNTTTNTWGSMYTFSNSTNNSSARSITQDTNGNYFVTGQVYNSTTSVRDTFVSKFDSSLNLIWTKTFTNTALPSNLGNTVAATQDGGVIVSLNGGTSGLIKLDSYGNVPGCSPTFCQSASWTRYSASPTASIATWGSSPSSPTAATVTASLLDPTMIKTTLAALQTTKGVAATATTLQVAASGNVCIGLSGCTNKLGVAGSIASSGSISANSTPDIAEYIPAAPDVETADVVMADPNSEERVIKANGTYNSAVVGVISDGTSSFLINPYGNVSGAPTRTDIKPMVLAGRVPVKISGENGPVKPGDYLTSASTPGYAMKATKAGATIGKSLGYFGGETASDKGAVLTLVNIGYHDPRTDVDGLQGDTLGINGDATIGGDMNVGGVTTLGKLVVNGNVAIGGSLQVAGNLTVAGHTTVDDITINGHVITAGNQPTITLADGLDLSNITLAVEGNDTTGVITITTTAQGPGTTITDEDAGLALAKLKFDSQFGNTPRVLLSASNARAAKLGAFSDQVNSEGFTLFVNESLSANKTYKFTYWTAQ